MKSFSIICCGVLCAVQAKAQTNEVRSLTLDEAIRLAVEHNLGAQVARYNPIIDRLAIDVDYGAYDPVLSASGREVYNTSGGGFSSTTGITSPPNQTYDTIYNADISGIAPYGFTYDLSGRVDRNNSTQSTDTGLSFDRGTQYTANTSISLQQHLLRDFWINGPQYQIAINKKTLKYDELGFRNQLIQTVSNTEQAYYELIYAYENIKVQTAALELADRLVAENKRKVEVGAMAPLDEKQAESQAASARANLIAAYGTLEAQQNVLKSLITDQYRTWHDASIAPAQKLIAVPERFDIQDAWRTGLTKRPDYLQAKVDLERRGITVKYRFNQLLPQVDLVGSYGRAGLAPGFSGVMGDVRDERLPSYTFGATLSIPLSNRSARYTYKEVKAQLEQATLQMRATEQTILVGIDNAIKSANTDFQRIQSTRSAREFAELALSAEQKKLEVGKSTSFEVLSLQRDLTAARLAEIRALADYNKDLSEIARQQGTTLEKFKLNGQSY